MCEIDQDECDSDPCMNGGVCVDHPGSYECMCKKGYVGQNCDTGKPSSGLNLFNEYTRTVVSSIDHQK